MSSPPDATSPDNRRAEFAAYRAEILGRSGNQHMLFTLNLTATGLLAGFVLSDHADKRLLLILPIVSGSIGLLWYDHARNIESLGAYIKAKLPEFGGYEAEIDRLERDELRRVPMTAALLVLFLAAPLAALFAVWDDVDGSLWALWILGLVTSAACAFFLVRWMLRGLLFHRG